jgi:hypothetical protein
MVSADRVVEQSVEGHGNVTGCSLAVFAGCGILNFTGFSPALVATCVPRRRLESLSTIDPALPFPPFPLFWKAHSTMNCLRR